ncbi:uncharacterized protein LOC111259940 [Varroa jacobsoni]|uniref:uncharacterized protein LOC111259940 n=1 Tax=Varroa jacobsoni TaxID=62625 RepID=UPI000BFAA676|nr:uncharacterized protein LOC111259940 [Varroa jacobsoni]
MSGVNCPNDSASLLSSVKHIHDNAEAVSTSKGENKEDKSLFTSPSAPDPRLSIHQWLTHPDGMTECEGCRNLGPNEEIPTLVNNILPPFSLLSDSAKIAMATLENLRTNSKGQLRVSQASKQAFESCQETQLPVKPLITGTVRRLKVVQKIKVPLRNLSNLLNPGAPASVRQIEVPQSSVSNLEAACKRVTNPDAVNYVILENNYLQKAHKTVIVKVCDPPAVKAENKSTTTASIATATTREDSHQGFQPCQEIAQRVVRSKKSVFQVEKCEVNDTNIGKIPFKIITLIENFLPKDVLKENLPLSVLENIGPRTVDKAKSFVESIRNEDLTLGGLYTLELFARGVDEVAMILLTPRQQVATPEKPEERWYEILCPFCLMWENRMVDVPPVYNIDLAHKRVIAHCSKKHTASYAKFADKMYVPTGIAIHEVIFALTKK